MTDADKDLVEAVLRDLVMPCGGEFQALPDDLKKVLACDEDLPPVLSAAAAQVVSELDCGRPSPATWLEEFFGAPNSERLYRAARRLGARTPTEALEVVRAAMADVANNADHVSDPNAYARRAIRHHLPRERRHYVRPLELAARGAGTAQISDALGLEVQEGTHWVLHVLQSLDGKPKQQQVMALYFDGFTNTEIAEGP